MKSVLIEQLARTRLLRLVLPCLWLAGFTFPAAKLSAQSPAAGVAAKPRVELSDSARKSSVAPAASWSRNGPTAAPPPNAPPGATPAASPPPGSADPATAAGFRHEFVRNQTALGVGIYAPAFATTVASDGLAWAASYLLGAGGSFVAAAEISRQLSITDPMYHLATGAPIRGAIAGSILAALLDADVKGTASAVLFSSVGATASALWLGQKMNDGEAAATLFGSDLLALGAYGAATAAGLENNVGTNRTRLSLALGGMIAGAPLGHAYAALASYHVSRGDLTALAAAGGVGMLAGLTAIAGGDRPDRQVAAALTIGGLAGVFVGDRLLVKRYDHTESEGRLLALGGLAGGLMGGGVALVARGDDTRLNALSGALVTAGAAGGIILSQRYLLPKADGGLRLGALKVNPMGVVAAATGMRGAYTLGSMSF